MTKTLKPIKGTPPPSDIIIPCMRGTQCHREYFVAQMPTGQVRQLLQVCDVAANRHRPSATDFSAIVQRSIDWGRVRKLVKYVLHGFGANNVRQGDFYILPGITVAFNPGAGAVIEFESLVRRAFLSSCSATQRPSALDTIFQGGFRMHD